MQGLFFNINMDLGIMNNHGIFASLLLIIGSVLAIIPIIPLPSNFFPIYSIKTLRDAGNTNIRYFSLWGEIQISIYKNGFDLPTGSTGWTPLGISAYILIFIFALLGMFSIILSFNTFLKALSSNEIENITVARLVGIFIGVLFLLFGILIFLAYSMSNSTDFLYYFKPLFGSNGWIQNVLLPFILIFIITFIVLIGLFMLYNRYVKSVYYTNARNIPITATSGVMTGSLILFVDLLIFYGNSLSTSKTGLQFIEPQRSAGIFGIEMTIGLGYWFLVLAGLLILYGSLVSLSVEKNLKNKVTEYSQREEILHVRSSSNVDQFQKEIEEIIQEGETDKISLK